MAAARRSSETDSETRSLLLDAAQALMVEEGYAAVTTRQVAARAGVNKALVYYYFGTMDDLFLALFRRGAERTLEREAQALSGPQPLWALWDMAHDRTSNDLTSEIVALANHRKALRAEIAAYSRKFRKVQVARIGAALRDYGVDPDEWPVAGVVVAIAGISRFLLMEESMDLTLGHRQAVELVERFISSVEGERLGRRPAGRAG
jgi:AcrR family transcriptional regulator